MSFSVIALLKAIILPPTINFLLVISGLLLFKKYKKYSQLLIYIGVLSLVLFFYPPFSQLLIKSLERYPPLEPPVLVNNEQAIVVLSAGSYTYAREFGKATDGAAALERNHYAAFLHKQTGLPILVSGGHVGSSEISEASVMADTLTNSFNVFVTWQETKSKNTAENASYSVAILNENGIKEVFLVTHAWHMLRAVMMFEKSGIKVTAAPTVFTSNMTNSSWRYYFPDASALLNVRIALHEYIGIVWYRLRY